MTLVLTADRVWTGVAGGLLTDGAIVVTDGTIAWVGSRAAIPDPFAAAPRRDYGDATILPGLIESHAHLCYDGAPGTKRRSFDMSAPMLVAQMLKSCRELVAVGVTTVRDLGSRDNLALEARDIVAQGIAQGPRILAAGSQLTTTGGHTWQNHGAADSADELRKRVRLHHKDGVDLIKINATGGFMTAGSVPAAAQFSTDELATVVVEAHRLGKRVAAHAHGAQGIARAVDAGVDTLEHCTFVAADGSIAPDADVIAAIVRKDIHVCPTATWNLPRMMRDRGFSGPPVKMMRDAGVKLVAGNDAGIDGVPHTAYVGGLETLAMLGLSAEEVLVAATSGAAAALDLDDQVGRIAEGFAADLIVAAGDPTTDVSRLRDLREVMIAGAQVARDYVAVPAQDPHYRATLNARDQETR